MGKKLDDIYEAIKKEGGMSAQMRLAMMGGMTSAQAKTVPDTSDAVKKFANAYKEITGKNCPVN